MKAGLLILGSLLSQLAVAQVPQNTPIPTPVPTAVPTPQPINPTLVRKFKAGTPVEHTSVKDQGGVGFCWSYSGMGLIEGEQLKKNGEQLDLSEEYIGFMYIYEQILKNAPTYFEKAVKEFDPSQYDKAFKRKKAKKKTKWSNAWNGLVINFLFKVSEGAPDLNLVMDLAKKYGVVPEDVFNYKIQGKNAEEGVTSRIMDFVNGELRHPEKNKKYRQLDASGAYTFEPNADAIFEGLAKAYTLEDNGTNPDGNCDSCDLLNVKNGFNHNGGTYTAKTFLDNYLRFNPEDYTQIKVNKENFEASMQKMRSSLQEGYSVQMGVLLLSGFSEAVKGNGILMPENCGTNSHCKVEGGHAILAINHTEDPMSGNLNGIIIKNSWGPYGLDHSGKKQGELGFQIITPDYLSKVFNLYQGEGKEPKAAEWFIHIHKKFN